MATANQYEALFVARGQDGVIRAMKQVGDEGERAAKRVESATRGADPAMRALNSVIGDMRNGMAGMASQSGVAGRALSSMGAGGTVAAAGIGAVVLAESRLVPQLAKFSDQATSARNSLTLVLGSTGQAADVFGKLQGIAIETGTSFDSLRDVFFRVASAAKDVGLSTDQVVELSGALAKLNAISGASGPAAEGAMVQLGQALASARVQAEEFNSVAEGMPAVMQLFADHIEGAGGSVGKLKQLVNDGAIAGRDFAQVLIRSADDIDKKYQELPKTIGASMDGLGSAIGSVVQDIDSASGASDAFRAELDDLKKTVLDLRAPIMGIVSAVSDMMAVIRQELGSNVFDEIAKAALTPLGPLRAVLKLLEDILNRTKEVDSHGATGSWGDSGGATGSWGDATTSTSDFKVTPSGPGGGSGGGKGKKEKPAKEKSTGFNPLEIMDTLQGIQKQEASARESALDTLKQIKIATLEAQNKIIEAIEMRRDREIEALEKLRLTEEEKAQARVDINAKADAEIAEAKVKMAKDAAKDVDKSASDAEDSFKHFAFTAVSSFGEAVVAGKSLSDVIKGIIEDLIKMLVQITIIEPAMKGLAAAASEALGSSSSSSGSGGSGGGGILGFFGSLFGGGGSTSSTSSSSGSSSGGGLSGFFGSLFGGSGSAAGGSAASSSAGGGAAYEAYAMHGGGTVGHSYGSYRSLPASMFESAPRFHAGLLADEFPAVLQRGEGVMTRSQMRSMSDRPSRPNVIINNYSGRDVTAQQDDDSGDITVGIDMAVSRAIARPNSRSNRAVSQVGNPRKIMR